MKLINKIPFDREYATSYKSEVKWLSEHGIRYVFVKNINTITTYKYKKNSKLYEALAEFYKCLESGNTRKSDTEIACKQNWRIKNNGF